MSVAPSGTPAPRAAAPAGVGVVVTERLALRPLVLDDAPFIRELLNDPDWIRFIGDKGVRTDDDARGYLLRGPIAMYARCGFGLCHVALREGGVPIGMCGLIKRDTLPDVDIGFAFLPAFRHRGYAREAAAAVIAQGATVHRLKRIVAIASPDNARSLALLERLGMAAEGRLPGSTDEDPLVLYGLSLP